MAFDTLAIPAMPSECEGLQQCQKLANTGERNALADDITEATKCLNARWAQGFIQQQNV
jgi:hypothetical protein